MTTENRRIPYEEGQLFLMAEGLTLPRCLRAAGVLEAVFALVMVFAIGQFLFYFIFELRSDIEILFSPIT